MTRIDGAIPPSPTRHSVAGHARLGPEAAAQPGHDITSVRNVARPVNRSDSVDSGFGERVGTGRQGHMLVPKLGDDVAKSVMRHAATRIMDGKDPTPVIFATDVDLARFEQACADYRSQLAGLLADTDGIDSPTLEKIQALHEAGSPGRIPVASNASSGVLGRLGSTDKLYVLGHGSPGAQGIWYKQGNSEALFRHQDIASLLAKGGLARDFTDIRLLACEGACVPGDGGPTSAERFLDALAGAGFDQAAVSAYPGVIELMADRLADDKVHRQVLVGEEKTPVQASKVRQVFRYADVDYMNLEDWRQLHDTASDAPPPLPPRRYAGAS